MNPRGAARTGRRRWADLSPVERLVVAGAAAVQLALAAMAWWDLAHRQADQVRGPKALWAAMIAVNFAGPLAYFRWGRLRHRPYRRRGCHWTR
ncbi:PLDc N-terminal domain-containing protein [Amycolatopsis sp. FDAARGOS 1241]|uniref:PLDc N-terminal domain-containing protein n=1 Tax=Amycolatopsis sp. FDAARGOS 1241 TaxID=2778070 RepID=UPI00194F9B92|nr:PLDc N-terminal domain-containing protein [Amycolatopsis sp. FDAARGOS 1241]QRP49432.1 PLDc N-terminal domain-containing protein [Amycolatopsis sp. FDAARGOS 1241]